MPVYTYIYYIVYIQIIYADFFQYLNISVQFFHIYFSIPKNQNDIQFRIEENKQNRKGGGGGEWSGRSDVEF